MKWLALGATERMLIICLALRARVNLRMAADRVAGWNCTVSMLELRVICVISVAIQQLWIKTTRRTLPGQRIVLQYSAMP